MVAATYEFVELMYSKGSIYIYRDHRALGQASYVGNRLTIAISNYKFSQAEQVDLVDAVKQRLDVPDDAEVRFYQ